MDTPNHGSDRPNPDAHDDLDWDIADPMDARSGDERDTQRHGSGMSIWAVLALLIGVGAALYVILNGADEAVYAYTVDQATEQVGDLQGKVFRVRGTVQEGSIVHKPGTLLTRFDIVHKGKTLTISYTKPLPDTFQAGVEVIAEGELSPDGALDADNVVAKCPSKYEEGAPTAKGGPGGGGAPAKHPEHIPKTP